MHSLRSFSSSTESNKFDIDASSPKWYHYVLCGIKGVLEHLELAESVGMSVMVDGLVPKAAGLSSSSALVCAAAIATMHANGKQIQKV